MKKLKPKKTKAGGKREGSGRTGKFSEPTEPVAFKCPISKVDEFKEYGNAKLSEWSVKQRITNRALCSLPLLNKVLKFN